MIRKFIYIEILFILVIEEFLILKILIKTQVNSSSKSIKFKILKLNLSSKEYK
jgi:hypothetical protein